MQIGKLLGFIPGSIWFYLALFVLLGLSIGFVRYANVYHGELDVYLPHYLALDDLINIVFSPICELDFTKSNFRAREFGSLFNWIDAKILVFLVGQGFDVLLSPIYYIVLLTCVFYTKFALKGFKVSNTNSNLLVLLLLTIPPVLLGGIFYRANKIVAAGFVLMALLSTERLLEDQKSGLGWINRLFLFVACTIASLSDEQGFALVIMIFLYVIGKMILLPEEKRWLAVGLPLGLSITIVGIYRFFIGPEIFYQVNGAYPVASNGGWSQIGGVDNIIKTLGLLVRYLGYVFANFQTGNFLGLIFLLLLLFVTFGKVKKNKWIINLIPFVLPCLMLIYTFSLMTTKHPAIYWQEIVSYYSLPLCFFAYGVFVVQCKNSLSDGSLSSNRLVFVLLFIMVMNLISLPRYINSILNGHLQPFRVATGFFNAVYGDAALVEDKLKEYELKNLSPGAWTLFIMKDGVQAMRKALK